MFAMAKPSLLGAVPVELFTVIHQLYERKLPAAPVLDLSALMRTALSL
jgi:hypothetical protein